MNIYWLEALKNDQFDCFRFMIHKLKVPIKWKGSPLRILAFLGKEKAFFLLVDEYSQNIKERDKNGCSLLSYAVHSGNLDFVKRLEPHFPLNEADQWGGTALFYAVKKGHEQVARHLIDKGARLDCFNKDLGHLIEAAVLSGNNQLVIYLVEEKRVPIPASLSSHLILLCCEKNNLELMEWLREKYDQWGYEFFVPLEQIPESCSESFFSLATNQGFSTRSIDISSRKKVSTSSLLEELDYITSLYKFPSFTLICRENQLQPGQLEELQRLLPHVKLAVETKKQPAFVSSWRRNSEGIFSDVGGKLIVSLCRQPDREAKPGCSSLLDIFQDSFFLTSQEIIEDLKSQQQELTEEAFNVCYNFLTSQFAKIDQAMSQLGRLYFGRSHFQFPLTRLKEEIEENALASIKRLLQEPLVELKKLQKHTKIGFESLIAFLNLLDGFLAELSEVSGNFDLSEHDKRLLIRIDRFHHELESVKALAEAELKDKQPFIKFYKSNFLVSLIKNFLEKDLLQKPEKIKSFLMLLLEEKNLKREEDLLKTLHLAENGQLRDPFANVISTYRSIIHEGTLFVLTHLVDKECLKTEELNSACTHFAAVLEKLLDFSDNYPSFNHNSFLPHHLHTPLITLNKFLKNFNRNTVDLLQAAVEEMEMRLDIHNEEGNSFEYALTYSEMTFILSQISELMKQFKPNLDKIRHPFWQKHFEKVENDFNLHINELKAVEIQFDQLLEKALERLVQKKSE